MIKSAFRAVAQRGFTGGDALLFLFIYILVWLALVYGWVQSIVWALKTESYWLGIIGAIVSPVGVVNGWGIGLGLWG